MKLFISKVLTKKKLCSTEFSSLKLLLFFLKHSKARWKGIFQKPIDLKALPLARIQTKALCWGDARKLRHSTPVIIANCYKNNMLSGIPLSLAEISKCEGRVLIAVWDFKINSFVLSYFFVKCKYFSFFRFLDSFI